VDGVSVVRHIGSAILELISKSYRPRSGSQRGLGQLEEALAELGRGTDPGAPATLARRRIVGGERLAPAGVENREAAAIAATGRGQPVGQRIERADACQRQAGAGAERPGAGDADPQAGEGAGTEPDRDAADRVPATRRLGRSLDLLEQPRRVPGATVGGEAVQRLVEDLPVARSADGSVLRRRVEADQRQMCPGTSRGR
jgi:hypothetical protein